MRNLFVYTAAHAFINNATSSPLLALIRATGVVILVNFTDRLKILYCDLVIFYGDDVSGCGDGGVVHGGCQGGLHGG